MSKYVCLDTSVLLKLFFPEEDTEKAHLLMQGIAEANQIIVLPTFAWAEFGSVVRKKIRAREIKPDTAEELWQLFLQYPGIEYLDGHYIREKSWLISSQFDLPTIYDAAFLATAELIQEGTRQDCQIWTADQRLINALQNKKKYVHSLREL